MFHIRSYMRFNNLPSCGEIRGAALLAKLSYYPVQRLHMHHRALVCLLVVCVEHVVAALHEHRALSCTYPCEVELRKSLDDAPEHFRADVALARVHVVGDVLGGEVADPLKVALRLAQSLRLRPLSELAEAEDGSLFYFIFFGHIRENDYICFMKENKDYDWLVCVTSIATGILLGWLIILTWHLLQLQETISQISERLP